MVDMSVEARLNRLESMVRVLLTRNDIGGSIGGTAGSVLFVGTNGVLGENNSNFFWDNTNLRLGLGTASPQRPLSLVVADGSGIQIRRNSVSANTKLTIGFRHTTSESATNNCFIQSERTNLPVSGDQAFEFFTNSTTEAMRIEGQNVMIKSTAVGTSGVGVLGIGSGTEPSTSPADMIQFYSVDLSAGNATLGLRTETAVAADVALASTHSLSVVINGTGYKIPLTAL